MTAPVLSRDYLSPAELAALTDYERPTFQARWLREHGWVFEQGKCGPKVLRSYRDKRLGMESPYETVLEPDFSAIS